MENVKPVFPLKNLKMSGYDLANSDVSVRFLKIPVKKSLILTYIDPTKKNENTCMIVK